MGKLIDLKGKTFGEWTVLYRDTEWDKIRKKPTVKWICRCSCGTIRSVSGTNLINHRTQSCGCKKNIQFKDNVKKWNDKKKNENIFCIKNDLTGKVFGNVKVLGLDIEKTKQAREEKGKLAKAYWKCQCQLCGNIFSPSGNDLVSGGTNSCGCQRKNQSKGAQKIEELLLKNHIKYRKEVTFPDLKDIALLRYDFALLNNKDEIIKLIEFDGQQHFQKNNSLYHTPILEKHDKMKNDYAKKHNIPLLRISYLEIDNITINDLLLKEKI